MQPNGFNMIVKAFPTRAQIWPVTPKGKVDKLRNLIVKNMMFPDNQPGWRVAGVNGEEGFNVRLVGIYPAADIETYRQELLEAGWELRQVKHHAGNTIIVLVDVGEKNA